MFDSGVDIEIQKDRQKGCNIININDSDYLEIWPLAKKLQSSGFVITKILQNNYVLEYDAENFSEEDSDDIETVILEYEYADITYVFELDIDRIIIRPICFLQEFFPESCKLIFHSIATPFSTMLQVLYPCH